MYLITPIIVLVLAGVVGVFLTEFGRIGNALILATIGMLLIANAWIFLFYRVGVFVSGKKPDITPEQADLIVITYSEFLAAKRGSDYYVEGRRNIDGEWQ